MNNASLRSNLDYLHCGGGGESLFVEIKKKIGQKNSEQSNRDVTELARGGVAVARHGNVGKVGRVALRQPEV